MKDIYILGINSVYHEPAVCIMKNGQIVMAVEEERFNRIRHGKFVLADNPDELPYNSIDRCLKKVKITLDRIDYIGYSFNPHLRLEKNLEYYQDNKVSRTIAGELGSINGEKTFYKSLTKIPALLDNHYKTNIKNKFIWLPHHLCHSASAYFSSPYQEAGIISVDGIGEFTTVMFAIGRNNKIKVIKEIEFPNSLGFLWTKASQYLGLGVGGRAEYGAGKVMALAAYGNPEKFYKKLKKFVRWDNKGNLFIDDKITQFRLGSLVEYRKLFGSSRKIYHSFSQRHMDFAAGLQKITNEVLLSFTNYLYKTIGQENLCLSGGVALNCTANSQILEKSQFENFFVQPAANDMGTALGAAYYICHQILNKPKVKSNYLNNVYLGTEYSDKKIESVLKKTKGIKYEKISNIEKITAYLIAKGLVVGWFQGKMEFGPRALGSRSILCDPRNPESYTKVSIEIKKREFFRPLAPSILTEKVDEWFYRPKGGSDSDQYMIFSYKLRDEKIGLVPAVTHVDNSGRIQVVDRRNNQRFYNLIKHFYRLTGVPMVVNTSLNISEPIVENPKQAIKTFLNSSIDILTIGNYLVFKKNDTNKKCYLYESKGKAISVKKFVQKWIDKIGLTDNEQKTLLSVNLPNQIPKYLKKVYVGTKELSKNTNAFLEVRRSGQRSAFWENKKIKFKGCYPQLKKRVFPTKNCFFGKEKEKENFRSFGIMTCEQIIREILGWAFFTKNKIRLHQKPMAIYDYGKNFGYCLILESYGEQRIEDFFDFYGITLNKMVNQETGTKYLPREAGLKNISVKKYIEKKSDLLIKMNFSGGFRDLLNSNIGNDYIINNKIYLSDFDSFKTIKIPKNPDEFFLRKFMLQCFVEAIKSSLPIIDNLTNQNKTKSYLEISSLYQTYRKKFYFQARKQDWNISKLIKIEKWVITRPIFTKEAKKISPLAIHGLFNTLPSEELNYKIH